MAQHNIYIGFKGEQIAEDYLSALGYSIIKRNYHSKWGEIDIIAKKDSRIYFVEVKTRLSDAKGKPYESISNVKVLNLKKAVKQYIVSSSLGDKKLALLIVCVCLNSNHSIKSIKLFDYSEVFERGWN